MSLFDTSEIERLQRERDGAIEDSAAHVHVTQWQSKELDRLRVRLIAAEKVCEAIYTEGTPDVEVQQLLAEWREVTA